MSTSVCYTLVKKSVFYLNSKWGLEGVFKVCRPLAENPAFGTYLYMIGGEYLFCVGQRDFKSYLTLWLLNTFPEINKAVRKIK